MSNFLAYRDGGKTNEQGLFQWLGKMFSKGSPTIGTPTSLVVTQRGAGANMSVDIAVGDVSIADTSYSYYGFTDAIVNQSIAAADPTNPRRDIVVVYVDKSVVSSASNNNPNALKFASVAGTPAGSPVDPSGVTIQAAVGAGNPYVQLARVAVVAAAGSIVNANITDLRQPISFMGRLWGGASNTNGHIVPNIADDTVALLAAAQTLSNKTFPTGSQPLSMIAGASAIIYDFVETGCVWTPDAAGSTLNGSMTSGFAWIGGVRVTIVAVTAHAFTLSKDTYVYVDNTGTVTYNAQTNNAASPSLPANSILLGIVVSGATNIASAASINQGQPTAALPIASSTPYVTNDSLGNLICPRDPNRATVGYTERITGQSSITALTDITGMSMTLITPANCYKIRLQAEATISDTTAGSTVTVSLTDSSNNIQVERSQIITSSNVNALQSLSMHREINVTPGTTYTFKLRASSGGSAVINQGNGAGKASTMIALRA